MSRDDTLKFLSEVLAVWSGRKTLDDLLQFQKVLKMLQSSDVIFDVKDILDLMKDVFNPSFVLSGVDFFERHEFKPIGFVESFVDATEKVVWKNGDGLVNITNNLDDVPQEGFKDIKYLSSKVGVDFSIVEKLLSEAER